VELSDVLSFQLSSKQFLPFSSSIVVLRQKLENAGKGNISAVQDNSRALKFRPVQNTNLLDNVM